MEGFGCVVGMVLGYGINGGEDGISQGGEKGSIIRLPDAFSSLITSTHAYTHR